MAPSTPRNNDAAPIVRDLDASSRMDRLVAASDVVVVTFVTPRSIAVENALQRIFLWFLQRRAVVFRGGVFVAELVLRFFGWGCEEGGGSSVVGLDQN